MLFKAMKNFMLLIVLLSTILALKQSKHIHSIQRLCRYINSKYSMKDYSILDHHNSQSKSIFKREFSIKSSKDNIPDYIDVEIVEDNSKKNTVVNPNNSINRKTEEFQSNSNSFGLFNIIKKTGQSALDKLSGLISDKEDPQLKLKKQQKKEINNQIDKVFENVGITGSIMGSAMKFMSNIMIDTISQQSSDIELVQLRVKELIENDSISKNMLGSSIEYSIPQQVSTSSMNINGIQTKNVYLRYLVSGSINNGQLEVRAAIDNSNKVLFKPNEIILQLPSGKIHNISINNNNGKYGKNDIIDVQVL